MMLMVDAVLALAIFLQAQYLTAPEGSTALPGRSLKALAEIRYGRGTVHAIGYSSAS